MRIIGLAFAAALLALSVAGCPTAMLVSSLEVLRPENGGLASGESVELVAQVPPGVADEVVFYGRSRAARPVNEEFTIVVLPDTQFYTAAGSDTFLTQSQWIIDNRRDLNIAAVLHLGDLVDDAAADAQWRLADDAIRVLESDPDLPIALAVGNHDQTPLGIADGTAGFNRYFPFSRFEGAPWYGGHFGDDNDNHYILFSAGGIDFVAISLQFDRTPDADVLAWADGVLGRHADRFGIVVSHFIITGHAFNNTFSPQGVAIRDALTGNPNLGLMLCGHYCGTGLRTDTDDGRRIHTILADYQCWPNGGDGWLRLLTFSPAGNEIRVRTYSPTLDAYLEDDRNDFTIAQALGGSELFHRIGRAQLGPRDVEVRMTWSGLSADSLYEWFITTNQGAPPLAGPIWNFVTAGQ